MTFSRALGSEWFVRIKYVYRRLSVAALHADLFRRVANIPS